MQWFITKYFIICSFLLTIFFTTASVSQAVVALSSPDVTGSVQAEGTNIGIDNVWVKWTDRNNNIRYTKTVLGGSFSFPSWQNMSQTERDNEYGNCIKPNEPNIAQQSCTNTLLAAGYSRISSTSNRDGAFGCVEDPHSFTAILPVGWNGSFSTTVINVNNNQASLNISPIYYSNSNSTFPTASISGPSLARPGNSVGYYSQASADAPINYIQMWYRLRPTATWTALGGTCSSITNSVTCPSSSTSNFTTELGTYDLVVNTHNIFNKWCGGSPDRPLPAGWADCGPNSKIVLHSYTAPTGTISVSTSGVDFNCTGNYCWGPVSNDYIFTAIGNDSNNKLNKVEIWAAKTDGTNWGTGVSCPVRISSSNPKWCLLKESAEVDANGVGSITLPSDLWTAPAAGNYYITLNAYNSFPGNNVCTGNPMEPLTVGWAKCSNANNDYIELELLTPAPTLGTLTIKEDSGAGAVGTAGGATYQVSGVRGDDPNLSSNQGGQKYFNSITVKPQANAANNADISLVGAAFTSKASPPSSQSLAELKRSADNDNGFVLIYARANTTHTAGPIVGSCGANNNFCAGKFYVYFQGVWSLQLDSTTPPYIYPAPTNPPALRVDIPSQTLPTNTPLFNVTFYKTLGKHTWNTYQYLRRTDSTEATSLSTPTQ